ncbi:MAG: hypothetical protein RIE59_09595 [Imperialibacter sp.]
MDLALDLERSCATSIYLYPNNHLPVALLPSPFRCKGNNLLRCMEVHVALQGGKSSATANWR